MHLPAEVVQKRLRTTPEHMVNFWRMSAMGGVLSGTLGVQGHYANGLAALYLACGQDVACVAESAVGVTRFEVTTVGDLYASVTLPNIMVGTVGGGTGLPSQKACLEILGLLAPARLRRWRRWPRDCAWRASCRSWAPSARATSAGRIDCWLAGSGESRRGADGEQIVRDTQPISRRVRPRGRPRCRVCRAGGSTSASASRSWRMAC